MDRRQTPYRSSVQGSVQEERAYSDTFLPLSNNSSDFVPAHRKTQSVEILTDWLNARPDTTTPPSPTASRPSLATPTPKVTTLKRTNTNRYKNSPLRNYTYSPKSIEDLREAWRQHNPYKLKSVSPDRRTDNSSTSPTSPVLAFAADLPPLPALPVPEDGYVSATDGSMTDFTDVDAEEGAAVRSSTIEVESPQDPESPAQSKGGNSENTSSPTLSINELIDGYDAMRTLGRNPESAVKRAETQQSPKAADEDVFYTPMGIPPAAEGSYFPARPTAGGASNAAPIPPPRNGSKHAGPSDARTWEAIIERLEGWVSMLDAMSERHTRTSQSTPTPAPNSLSVRTHKDAPSGSQSVRSPTSPLPSGAPRNNFKFQVTVGEDNRIHIEIDPTGADIVATSPTVQVANIQGREDVSWEHDATNRSTPTPSSNPRDLSWDRHGKERFPTTDSAVSGVGSFETSTPASSPRKLTTLTLPSSSSLTYTSAKQPGISSPAKTASDPGYMSANSSLLTFGDLVPDMSHVIVNPGQHLKQVSVVPGSPIRNLDEGHKASIVNTATRAPAGGVAANSGSRAGPSSPLASLAAKISSLDNGQESSTSYHTAAENPYPEEDSTPSPFDEPSGPHNAVFEYVIDTGKHNVTKHLVAATPVKLVEYLTTDAPPDFVVDFFITYRVFMSAKSLMSLLLQRVVWCLRGMWSGSGTQEGRRRLVLVKTLMLLEYWVDLQYDVDFAPSRTLRASLNTFLKTKLESHPNLANGSTNRQTRSDAGEEENVAAQVRALQDLLVVRKEQRRMRSRSRDRLRSRSKHHRSGAPSRSSHRHNHSDDETRSGGHSDTSHRRRWHGDQTEPTLYVNRIKGSDTGSNRSPPNNSAESVIYAAGGKSSPAPSVGRIDSPDARSQPYMFFPEVRPSVDTIRSGVSSQVTAASSTVPGQQSRTWKSWIFRKHGHRATILDPPPSEGSHLSPKSSQLSLHMAGSRSNTPTPSLPDPPHPGAQSIHRSFLVDYPPHALAQHFTHIEQQYILQVDWPHLLLTQSWKVRSSAGFKTVPDVWRVVDRFNATCWWVARELSKCEGGAQGKAAMLERVVEMARIAARWRNWSTGLAFVLAVQSVWPLQGGEGPGVDSYKFAYDTLPLGIHGGSGGGNKAPPTVAKKASSASLGHGGASSKEAGKDGVVNVWHHVPESTRQAFTKLLEFADPARAKFAKLREVQETCAKEVVLDWDTWWSERPDRRKARVDTKGKRPAVGASSTTKPTRRMRRADMLSWTNPDAAHEDEDEPQEKSLCAVPFFGLFLSDLAYVDEVGWFFEPFVGPGSSSESSGSDHQRHGRIQQQQKQNKDAFLTGPPRHRSSRSRSKSRPRTPPNQTESAPGLLPAVPPLSPLFKPTDTTFLSSVVTAASPPKSERKDPALPTSASEAGRSVPLASSHVVATTTPSQSSSPATVKQSSHPHHSPQRLVNLKRARRTAAIIRNFRSFQMPERRYPLLDDDDSDDDGLDCHNDYHHDDGDAYGDHHHYRYEYYNSDLEPRKAAAARQRTEQEVAATRRRRAVLAEGVKSLGGLLG
ncbi:uncharacterized protein EV422DRAFT_565129 [Fimicolochytrium jonesii]|uniref:uncharacterized protein n=1 Tax=Fimicolochytrium jonesii TaxID=1396493 RepID=UPI0022FE0301|nr:uncharacterized protein EV422DRAFT_565129 [Fimicolochytrium jonesii]KAI8824437.1 hypothetical protein EV422DRAFT_565129 [Fimicolochytrium jonesii]